MTFHQRIQERLADLVFQGRRVPVFLGDPPSAAAPPYAFVWARTPVQVSEDVGGCTRQIDEQVSVTVAAQSTVNALALAELVAQALDGYTPQVSGWHFSPLRHVGATDIQTDRTSVIEGTNMHPAWCVLRFRVNATKEET